MILQSRYIQSDREGATLRELRYYERARQLGEDTLTRFRRILGDDHPDTLRSAHNLAIVPNLSEHD